MLYAYKTLRIFFTISGRRDDDYITSSARYMELEEHSSKLSFTLGWLNTDLKDEEYEEWEEIADNIRYSEILKAIQRKEFSRRMSERELLEFERLEEEARENYKRLHPEEFDEEEED